MRIAVGSDHAGYEPPPPFYKPYVIEHLRKLGHEVIDCGTYGPESVDYPDYAENVCQTILRGEADRGILICGTGIGVGIAANRHRGIRAAPCTTPEAARLSREHNNSNVLCLGRRLSTLDSCIELIDIWLSTPFSNGERHVRRINKLG